MSMSKAVKIHLLGRPNYISRVCILSRKSGEWFVDETLEKPHSSWYFLAVHDTPLQNSDAYTTTPPPSNIPLKKGKKTL